jgi:hypothetical protein
MTNRRKALIAAATLTLVALTSGPTRAAETCFLNELGIIQCTVDGTIPGPPSDDGPPPLVGDRPPLRYLVVDTDYTGTTCFRWSRVAEPGAIDVWDPANDPLTITTLRTYPACLIPPGAPAVAPDDRAWEVYRSWTLAVPAPQLSPPAFGITGFPTYIGATAADLAHRETLPSGIELEVSAAITAVTIDWGDGAVERYTPADTAPYPSGSAAHTYALKTCTAAYRAGDPNGHLCHPTLEAYPITVTFTWTSRYRYDAGWIELESIDLSTTVAYDVDEVVGVPQG